MITIILMVMVMIVIMIVTYLIKMLKHTKNLTVCNLTPLGIISTGHFVNAPLPTYRKLCSCAVRCKLTYTVGTTGQRFG